MCQAVDIGRETRGIGEKQKNTVEELVYVSETKKTIITRVREIYDRASDVTNLERDF